MFTPIGCSAHRLTSIPPVDIINVVSVTQQATVNQWFEENDDDIQSALYWRQALDVRTLELSVCTANLPDRLR